MHVVAFPSLKAEKARASERGLDVEAIFRFWMVGLVGEDRADAVIVEGLAAAPIAPFKGPGLLSESERHALMGVAMGGSYKSIAAAMGKHEFTVQAQLKAAREKLQARTSAEAVAKALCSGAFSAAELEQAA